MNDQAMTQTARPELLREPVTGAFGVVQKPLSPFEQSSTVFTTTTSFMPAGLVDDATGAPPHVA